MTNAVLVTGGAGFIGSHLCEALLQQGFYVYSIDNLDTFYSLNQKKANLNILHSYPHFYFIEEDITQPNFGSNLPQMNAVFHLAAKAGVRPSLENPEIYFQANVVGTLAVLEFCRKQKIQNVVFTSSSSVYGLHPKTPWDENLECGTPISPYAASKRSAELLIHTYSHLYNLKTLCLRLFTVYGPRQRPDLAIHKFVQHIFSQKPISLYGDGSTQRDYTYIKDIVQGILQSYHWLQRQQAPCYEIFNLGSQRPITLKEMVGVLEKVMGKSIQTIHLPEQLGDVGVTYANIQKAHKTFKYSPQTPFEEGVEAFLKWFKDSLQINNHYA